MAKIVHFEIPVDNGERAEHFYGEVFGWQIKRWGDEPYWLVEAGSETEPGANGALVGRDDLHQHPTLIAGVDDIDAVLARVRARGGVVVQEKLPVPGVGWSAYVRDPEGNLLGLFEPTPASATT